MFPYRHPFLITVVFFLTACSSAPFDADEGEQPYVRVCLADSIERAEIILRDGAVIEAVGKRFSLDGHRVLECSITEEGDIQVSMDSSPARIFKGFFRCYYRKSGSRFEFEGKSYTDTLLFASDGKQLFVVNILPVETYLRGVVPNEIGRNRKFDEAAAVRAQAVVARTYTMMKIDLPLKRLFDVYDDSRDQMYNGTSTYDELTDRAVRETSGQVLIYNGLYAECYFHSTCGGKTEAVSLVWSRSGSKPYLTGVDDLGEEGDYCRISPSYRWSRLYTRQELERTLRTWLPTAVDQRAAVDIPEENWSLLDMRILKRMPSGRVELLNIVMGNSAHQRSYDVRADKIRLALRETGSERLLRSGLFDLHVTRDRNRWIRTVRIDGGGNGHGIGLCQWGAIGRARAGQNTEEILTTYFPRTVIEKEY